MSQKEDLEPYYQSGETGVEHRDIDASGSDHPFGDEPKEWEADLRPLIRQVADDLYETWEATVREYLANAETACLKVQQHLDDPESSPFDDMIVSDSYESRITVTWDKSQQKLIIQDNGIGMAGTEVDQVFRHIGRSAARDLGTMSGAFGMGALSFPKFIGPDNMMIMLSHSRLNDDNAAYMVTLAGIEPVRGELDDDLYGTKFKLDQKDADMDVRSAVERFSKRMRVPVLYTEIGEDGEEDFNEDWGEERLFNSYKEGEYADWIDGNGFDAYLSPEATSETLLLSMEIDRGSSHKYNAPNEFDVRITDESGMVTRSTNGNEGLIPVPQMEYEQMLLDARSGFITENLLSNKDIVAISYEGDADYAIDGDILEESERLPVAEYIPKDSADPQLLSRGTPVVISGPHAEREVISEERWSDLPEGRASQFVREDELEDFDVSDETGDLCLPKPTADRSSLQSNDEFWKYLAQTFAESYDDAIETWRQELADADDEIDALQSFQPQTVSDLKGYYNAQ